MKKDDIMSVLPKLPNWVMGNKFAKSDLKDKGQPWSEAIKNPMEECSAEEANLITSEAAPGKHYVMLDLDMDAKLVPSSTPGHHHLYIEKVLSWEEYKDLLTSLAVYGIISEGYLEASIEKGCTALRMPHVKKEPTDIGSNKPGDDSTAIQALEGEIAYLEELKKDYPKSHPGYQAVMGKIDAKIHLKKKKIQKLKLGQEF